MSHSLPPFYAHWLSVEPKFEAPPLECLADCERLKGPSSERFLAATKCCTYFPFLPNFAIGAMLERGGATRARIRIAMRLGVITPLGLFPTLAREARKAELGVHAFGRALELACPLYDSEAGGCGIWEFRPGVCASYFCVEVGLGREEWETRLNLFEWTLAHEVLWRQGFLQDEIEATEAARGAGEPAWFAGSSPGEEFYLDCARVALQVSRSEIAELMGNT